MVNPTTHLRNVQVSIDSYPLTNGTLSGGLALSAMRINVQRIFDVVIPISERLTEGTLVIGMLYRIEVYHGGDDFTNVGGTNITGDIFIATGTTPNVWLFESVLVPFAPVLFDRNIVRTSIDFQITRIHASFASSDIYVADHDAAIPSSGPVLFLPTSGPFSPATNARFLIHAALISHQLVKLNGKATTHAYHIEGGRFNTNAAYFRLLEDGYYRLLEDGGRRELEH